MKKARARSLDAKQRVFTAIIQKGKDLFLKYGVGGFTLRALATELEMGQASLYTYFQSKRELWFAIVEEDFKEIETNIEEYISNYSGRFIDLPIKITKMYFDAITEDYRKFKLIFKTTPPRSSKKGPIEQHYEIKTIKILEDIFHKASLNGEIRERETSKLAYFTWSLIFGTALSTQTESFGTIEKIPYFGTIQEYFDFVLRKLESLMDSLRKN